MNEECPFCVDGVQIVEIKNNIKIFYPHRPLNDYHLLIMPTRHVLSVNDLSEEELLEIFKTVKNLVNCFSDKFEMVGYNLFVNNGVKAGQKLPHVHFHFLPRFEPEIVNPFDKLNRQDNDFKVVLPDEEIKRRAEAIKFELVSYL